MPSIDDLRAAELLISTIDIGSLTNASTRIRHDEISLNCSLVESANPATKQFFASLRVGHQPGRRHWAVPQVAGHPAHR